VLDPTYIPAPVGESETLFQYQQQFLLAVFTQTLKDPTAKDILLKHRRHGDAQKIYRDLVTAATTSAQAKIAKSELVAFLTTKSLDNTWRGTHDGFILHWESQARKYDELALSTEKYSPGQKYAMLSKAVRNIDYLRAVENTNELLSIGGNPSADFDKYLSLLRATA